MLTYNEISSYVEKLIKGGAPTPSSDKLYRHRIKLENNNYKIRAVFTLYSKRITPYTHASFINEMGSNFIIECNGFYNDNEVNKIVYMVQPDNRDNTWRFYTMRVNEVDYSEGSTLPFITILDEVEEVV